MAESNPTLQGITSFDKGKLKPTVTVVRHRVDFADLPDELQERKAKAAKSDEDLSKQMLSDFDPTQEEKPLWTWNSSRNEWTQVDNASAKPEDFNHTTKSLRFVSYNIWFDAKAKKERTEALFALIEKLRADIVCLQEVTQGVLDSICKHGYFRKGWFISDVKFSNRSYGVAILSRFRPKRLFEYELPTRMTRSAIMAQFSFNNEEVSVATVHLESLDSRVARRSQLKVIYGHLKASKHTFLMGDFNFDSTKNFSTMDKRPLENLVLQDALPDFVDTWASLKPNDPGLTFDSDTNPLLNPAKKERMRYDRVVFKSAMAKPQRIKVIGNTPFEVPSLPNTKVCVSDHYGLYSKFQL